MFSSSWLHVIVTELPVDVAVGAVVVGATVSTNSLTVCVNVLPERSVAVIVISPLPSPFVLTLYMPSSISFTTPILTSELSTSNLTSAASAGIYDISNV